MTGTLSAETRTRDLIVRVGASLFERGLTPGSTGNISVRCDDGFLMTPTGSTLGMLDPARLSRLDAEGRHVSGDAPTKEQFLHLAMYRERVASGAVIHLHATHSVAVSLLEDIDPNDGDWKAFVESVVGLINTNGRANIVIEASASKVPTKTFGTNEKLSRQRMEDARNRLIDAVRERGADPDLMFVEAINSLVQGPSYRRDHADTEKYGKFQYVKLKTR